MTAEAEKSTECLFLSFRCVFLRHDFHISSLPVGFERVQATLRVEVPLHRAAGLLCDAWRSSLRLIIAEECVPLSPWQVYLTLDLFAKWGSEWVAALCVCTNPSCIFLAKPALVHGSVDQWC